MITKLFKHLPHLSGCDVHVYGLYADEKEANFNQQSLDGQHPCVLWLRGKHEDTIYRLGSPPDSYTIQ